MCNWRHTLDNPNNKLYLLPPTSQEKVCKCSFYRAARTDAGSSRYSGSSSPSSCLVYIGSRAEEWTAVPSWRSHTGCALQARASCSRPPPRTAWGCADVGCRCHRWSRCLRRAGSPSRLQTEPCVGLLQDKTDKGRVSVMLWSPMMSAERGDCSVDYLYLSEACRGAHWVLIQCTRETIHSMIQPNDPRGHPIILKSCDVSEESMMGKNR